MQRNLNNLLTILLIFLLPSIALEAGAENVTVKENESIAEAISSLVGTSGPHTITLRAGRYQENLQLPSNITLQGEQTNGVFLESASSNLPVISISSATSVVVRRITFQNADIAISVGNSSTDIVIENNAFDLQGEGFAIANSNSFDVLIRNNTFFDCKTGITGVTTALRVSNNIFASNERAITSAISNADLLSVLTFNCFDNNTFSGPQGSDDREGNSAFVNSASNNNPDFHLRAESACIDEGEGSDGIDDTRADMGAYGGPNADVKPTAVETFTAALADDRQSINVSWSANADYRIAGYELYYDDDESGSPYEGGLATVDGMAKPSPIDVGNVTSFNFVFEKQAGLVPPTLQSLAPSNQSLQASWSAVAGADGYRLTYQIADRSTDPVVVDLDETVRRYTIRSLQNDVEYAVKVQATANPNYYINLLAYDNQGENQTATDANKSNFTTEQTVNLGETLISNASVELTAKPQVVTPHPDLPDEGCFIATAAFGYYSAPQVQVLRDFRDHYLLTHPPGKAFVQWYYHYGPQAAAYINHHAWLKGVVRVLLYPLILFAQFLFSPSVTLWIFILAAGLLTLLFVHRRRSLQKLRTSEV